MRTTTLAVMERIQGVIQDTITPSWVRSVPIQFGDPSVGTLKADKWRTLFTIYLPITLVSFWGAGMVHLSEAEASWFCAMLDHTMNLVSATILVCMQTMTMHRATAFQHSSTIYIQDIAMLYPNMPYYRPNHHVAQHTVSTNFYLPLVPFSYGGVPPLSGWLDSYNGCRRITSQVLCFIFCAVPSLNYL